MRAHAAIVIGLCAACGLPSQSARGSNPVVSGEDTVDVEAPVALTRGDEARELVPVEGVDTTPTPPRELTGEIEVLQPQPQPPQFAPDTTSPGPTAAESFAATSSTPGNYMGVAVVRSGAQAGSYVLVGTTEPGPTGRDILVEKYNAAGTLQWQRIINGAANADDYGTSVAIEAAGAAIYVAGAVHDANDRERDAFLRKYDSNGTVLWTRTVDGTEHDNDILYGVALDEAGNGVVVAGMLRNLPHFAYNDGYGARYTPAGALVWSFSYNGPGNQHDSLNSVAVDENGNAGFGGYTSLTADPGYARFTAYARMMTRTGGLMWQGTFPRANGGTSTIREVSYANGVWAGAVSNNDPNESGGAIGRYTTAGQVLSWWELADITPRSVAVSSTGAIYVAGDRVSPITFFMGRFVNGSWAWQLNGQPSGAGYAIALNGNRLVGGGFDSSAATTYPYRLSFSPLP